MKAIFRLVSLIHQFYNIPEESRPALFFILQAAGVILLAIGFYWLVKEASS